jgi:hypothetical protein
MSLGKHFGDSKRGLQGSAIDDDSQDLSGDEGDDKAQKARIRRASDGQPLIKEGRKNNRVEVRCETCGKGYKHSSCLIKHRLVHPLTQQNISHHTESSTLVFDEPIAVKTSDLMLRETIIC